VGLSEKRKVMNLKIWTWKKNARIKRDISESERYLAFVKALTESLRHTQIGMSHSMHVTHAQRPPAPRPFQMTVTYIMVDGMEYRTFIPLNGQVEWVEQMPHYVQMNAERVSQIRYSMQYNDGGML
jgi:hypothetical protein